jgi:hypothetical protein
MTSEIDYPAGPVADKLTLWPVDDGATGSMPYSRDRQASSAVNSTERHSTALAQTVR